MSQYVELQGNFSDQQSLVEIAKALEEGKVIAYPTNSGYALGCKMGLKKPLEKIKAIRALDDKHNFTLICRDLSEIAQYAKVDNTCYRLLKRCTPGAYTFILPATKKVPVLMLNKTKKTVGIRVPDHPVPLSLLEILGEPLLSATLILPNTESVIVYAEDIVASGADQMIDYIIASDYCGYQQTTVVDMTKVPFSIIRLGGGDPGLIK